MSHVLRTRLGRIGLVAALLAGVLAVSFGTGYRASQAALDDGSAALTKGHTVVRVNGESGRVDAKLTAAVAKGRQQTRVVELPDGQLYVENTATGERWKVDTTTMTPQPLPAGAKGGGLVGGGSEMYSVDRASGRIGWVHPRTRAITPVATLGRVQGVEVDSTGTAWVLAGGKLHRIARTAERDAVDVGGTALLTLVGDRPTVLRLDAGEVVRYGRTAGDVQRARVPDLGGRSADDLRIAVPGPGDALWVAVAGDRTLLRVDLPTAQVRSVRLAADGRDARTGRPVVSGDKVLVPDYTTRTVHVLDGATGAERRRIGPVPGSSSQFDVVARGSKVFLNDQYASRGVVVDRDGTDRTIDKGSGDGLPGSTPKPDRAPPGGGDDRDDPDPGQGPGAGPDDRDRDATGAAPGRTGGRVRTPRQPAPPPPPVPVPDVIGQDRQAACATLRAAKLDCVQVPVGNDGAGPTGLVLRTDPAPDAMVPPGRIVTVSYRGDIVLPDLTGLPSATACSAVEAAGLGCDRDEQPAVADPAAVDRVTAQDPAAGTPARTGDRVRVSYPAQVLIPDVRTLLVADACARLAASGLACTQVDAGTRPAAEPPNVVLDQDPAAAGAAAPGTAVRVRFYSSVVVPAVTGLDPAAAQAAIAAQGLTPVPVPDLVTVQQNVVEQQSPAAGSPAAPGTQVQYVYEDAAPAQVRLTKKNGAFKYALEPQPGYTDQGSLGRGFSALAGGTGAVYRYVCRGTGCGGLGTFYYSMTNVPSYGAGWTNDGPAFYAYGSQADPRMLPVMGMFDGTSWVWAIQGSAAYQTYLGRGYDKANNFVVCWLWPA